MKLSTRMKFTLLIFGALGALAAAIGFFTSYRVQETISQSLQESSGNAVRLSANHVRDIYQGLFRVKVDRVMRSKSEILLHSRIISELAQGEGDFLNTLQGLPLPDGFSLWVLDEDLRVVLQKGLMPADFNPYVQSDMKGRAVGRTMLRLAKDGQTATSLVQADNLTNSRHKFFGHHIFLTSRKLLVGLWVDIRPYEEEEERNLKQAIINLEETFRRIRLGPSGFLFVVDANGKPVIKPVNSQQMPSPAAINPISGRTLQDDISLASKNPGHPIMAEMNTVNGKRSIILFSDYVRPLKWHVVGLGFVDEIENSGRNLSLSLVVAILVVSTALAILALMLVGRMTAPLVKLADFARRLPQADFFRDREALETETLRRLADNRQGDEVEELAKALLFMDGALRARIQELVAAAGNRERMEGELRAATRIQMGFLPKPLPAIECAGRFQLAAELIPAREVGGDLYDYFMLDDHRLCLVIGDVSGKGVPAALFMSMTMVLILANATATATPAEVLDAVNRSLFRNNANDMFVTIFIGILDIASGEFSFANGGHNPPLVISPSGTRWLTAMPCTVVGVFDFVAYEDVVTCLKRDETLLLYSDGLTEAMNSAGELFGEDALEQLFAPPASEVKAGTEIAHAAPRDSVQTLEQIRQAVNRHVNGAEASDDLTLLCFSWQ